MSTTIINNIKLAIKNHTKVPILNKNMVFNGFSDRAYH